MYSPLKILLLTFTFLSVVFATCLDDLKVVDAAVQKLITLADQYTGTGSQSVAIGTGVKDLINKINTANSNAAGQPSPSVSVATSCYNYLCVSPLYPDTVSLLNKTKAKRATFTSAGIKPNILQYLKDVKAAADKLADTYISKAPTSDLKSKGATCKANYDSKFNDAITYFS